MSTEIIEIKDREKWLQERVKDVTSTEVSALYGLSPYKSEFELFHEKRDGLVVELPASERMKWGNRLEAVIAHGVAEDMGWNIKKMDIYMRDLDVRMGSSFDFQILSSSDGPGILEIKNVDRLQYLQSWVDDGAGNIEGPAHIELQVQHQLEISGFEWAAIAVLVGGNETKVVLRNREKEIGTDLRAKVSAFWDRVNSGRAPTPDYRLDSDYIIQSLAKNANAGEVLQADAELEDLIEKFNYCHKTAADMDAQKKIWRAQILERIGTASKVMTSFGSLSCGLVKGRAGTLVTPDMVGTYIGKSEGHRNFRFYGQGEKQ